MTGIQWTDETWNPTTGCDRVSPGCDNCYALTMAGRLKGMRQPKYQRDGDPKTSGPGFGLTTHSDALDLPFRWRKPRMVFVNSMSDLFHEAVPVTFIAAVFDVMRRTPQHTYQILTKRHARMRSLARGATFGEGWPLPNVWLGVSAEDQKWADIRIPALLDTPAAVRFISAEPLLGPVKVSQWLGYSVWPNTSGPRGGIGGQALTLGPGIDWVIVGGESGRSARPMAPDWAFSLRDQCRDNAVPFFFKQRGEWTWEAPEGPYTEPHAYVCVKDGRVADEGTAFADRGAWAGVWRVGKKQAGRLLDGREWNEFPVAAKAAA